MAWKNVKLSRKFIVGFGVVLVLLTVVGGWSIMGIGGIVRNAGEVIDGNKLRGEFVQKIVDHLNWAGKVNTFLTDENVHELKVQFDPHKCGFGKWYYGEGRSHAEHLVPSLKGVMQQVEQPHTHLHESAALIKEQYRQVDPLLGGFLSEKKADHLAWAGKIKSALLDSDTDEVEVQKDWTKCGLGKWLYSEEVAERKKNDPSFAAAIKLIYEPHKRLHGNAVEIEEYLSQGERQEAVDHFKTEVLPVMEQTLGSLESVIQWQAKQMEGYRQAMDTYAQKTQPALAKVQGVLGQAKEIVGDNVMTDQAMLGEASKTSTIVIVIGIVALVIGIVIAWIIAAGILGPVGKGVRFAQAVGKGDYAAKLDVQQGDEIGILSDAMRHMVGNLKEKIQESNKATEEAAEEAEKARIAMGEAEEAKKMAERAKSEGMNAAAEQISGIVERVTSAAEELSAQVEQSSRGAETQRERAGETATAMEEMNATVLEVARNASSAAENATNAKEQAEEGAEVVKEVVEAINKVQTQATVLKENMSELGTQADGIGQIMNVISDIADQTNLLALNAAIEAARAGDAGRGFAVVADEVRKLAEKTMSATKEVGSSIQAIQEGTRKNMGETDKAVEVVGESTGLAGKAGDMLREILTLSETNADQVRNIATGAEEQSAASEEINRGAEEINRISSETSEAMNQSAQAVSELAELAQEMQRLVEEMRQA
jgi:methyl-accepting chemotaxis protein